MDVGLAVLGGGFPDLFGGAEPVIVRVVADVRDDLGAVVPLPDEAAVGDAGDLGPTDFRGEEVFRPDPPDELGQDPGEPEAVG